ncbi:MAG TPA: DUF2510 domain-containing protein [Diaminobutyricibacter sp.]
MTIQLEAAVPDAGWYEDPLSSTTMRWWNGLSWTEHTQKPSTPARDVAGKESTAGAGIPALGAAVAPALTPVLQNAGGDHPQSARSAEGTRSGRAPVVPAWLRPTRWNTYGIWAMSFTPWITLLIAVTVGALLTLGAAPFVVLGAVMLPLLLWIAFAVRDRRRLAALGYRKRASWAWVLLSPVAYEVARFLRVRRASGHGWAPLVVLVANVVIVAGGVVGLALVVEAPTAPEQFSSVEGTVTGSVAHYLSAGFLRPGDTH